MWLLTDPGRMCTVRLVPSPDDMLGCKISWPPPDLAAAASPGPSTTGCSPAVCVCGGESIVNSVS